SAGVEVGEKLRKLRGNGPSLSRGDGRSSNCYRRFHRESGTEPGQERIKNSGKLLQRGRDCVCRGPVSQQCFDGSGGSLHGPGTEIARHPLQSMSQPGGARAVLRGQRRTNLLDRVGLLTCKLAQQFRVELVVAADTAQPVRTIEPVNRWEIGWRGG